MVKFNTRAQMSSPFELLVAVIIMTFVIIIGTQMLGATQKGICAASVDRELTKFKINIESTANDRSANKFEFRPDNCYNESKAITKIQQFNTPAECGARCGIAGLNSCFVLFFYAPDLPGQNIPPKCLNISQYTTFIGQNDSKCSTANQELAGFNPIVPVGSSTDNIFPGTYALRNVSSAGETYPSVCVFWRK